MSSVEASAKDSAQAPEVKNKVVDGEAEDSESLPSVTSLPEQEQGNDKPQTKKNKDSKPELVEERPEDLLVTDESEGEGEDDEDESDSEEDSDEENENTTQKKNLTRAPYMPPPPKKVDRPDAVFDHNVLGLMGMGISGLQLYSLFYANAELKENGVDFILAFAVVTFFMCGAWAFLSNLEGFTRFPYITLLFFVSSLFPPYLASLSSFDATIYGGSEADLLYKSYLWSPLAYTILCTICAVINAENEREHGFTGTFYS